MTLQDVTFNKKHGRDRAHIRYASYNNGMMVTADDSSPSSTHSTMFEKVLQYKRISIVLSILVIVLVILLGVFIYRYTRISKNQNIIIKNEINKICTSDECIRSAASLRLSMDVSVNPCDDFYKYVCGRWDIEHPDHVWHHELSNFHTVKDRITTKVLTFLESNVSDSEPLPLKQARDFYTSCTDTETLDQLEYTVLFKHLKKLHLPVLPNFFSSNRSSKGFHFDWIKREVALKKTLGDGAFVELVVAPNLYNNRENVIYMGVPDTFTSLHGLRRATNMWKPRSWYNRQRNNKRKNIKLSELTYMSSVLQVILGTLSKVTNKNPSPLMIMLAARTIWKIKDDLETFAIYGILLNDNDQYEPMMINDIERKTNFNRQIDMSWRRYLTMVFNGITNVKLDLDNQDYVYTNGKHLMYLKSVTDYLSTIPDYHVELYMWWVAVHALISSTPAGYYSTEESLSFKESNLKKLRTTECVDLVVNAMNYAVTYAIADRDFLNSSKPKADKIVNNIKDAFKESVEDVKWMNSEAKEAVIKKSENLLSLVGFPNWLLNRTLLEDYYKTQKVHNNTFMDNVINIVKTKTHLNLASLRDANTRTWKNENPIEVNARNYLLGNVLALPMAMLTHPFYDLGLESLNFGAIGTLIGHEFIHGFDFEGIKYDMNGNLRQQWLNNQTILAYVQKISCFVNQYGSLSLPEVNKTVDGILTVSENLADSEGLRLAFSAYQSHLNKYGKEPNLPGFEVFSDDQMFFIAFASVWCGTSDTDILKYRIEYDEHSPDSIRVLGSLQNSPEFSNAFKCRIGSNLNPNRKKCRMW